MTRFQRFQHQPTQQHYLRFILVLLGCLVCFSSAFSLNHRPTGTGINRPLQPPRGVSSIPCLESFRGGQNPLPLNDGNDDDKEETEVSDADSFSDTDGSVSTPLTMDPSTSGSYIEDTTLSTNDTVTSSTTSSTSSRVLETAVSIAMEDPTHMASTAFDRLELADAYDEEEDEDEQGDDDRMSKGHGGNNKSLEQPYAKLGSSVHNSTFSIQSISFKLKMGLSRATQFLQQQWCMVSSGTSTRSIHTQQRKRVALAILLLALGTAGGVVAWNPPIVAWTMTRVARTYHPKVELDALDNTESLSHNNNTNTTTGTVTTTEAPTKRRWW
eukprot:Nitzschia sp. Nitz4//scaffold44_size153857//97153//98133//NITZ4_002733-RA/size153857-processed-gene-0.160-mRNA-1//-1//CDS//3329552193//2881//frame0